MATTTRDDWQDRRRELEAARAKFAAALADMDRIEAARTADRTKPAPSPRRATTMELCRNRDGVLYVRQPIGEPGRERIVTWHIDARGEADLRTLGIVVGSSLPSGVLARLRADGRLYTGSAPTRAQAPVPERKARRTGWTWSRWHDGRPA